MSLEYVPLRYVTSVLARGTAPNYLDDGPIRVVSQAANQDSGLDWERTRFHDFTGDPRKLKGYLEFGDSLVNSTGTGTLGRVGWFEKSPDQRPCVADGHVTVTRFDPTRVDKRFGFYYLKSDEFQEFMFETLVNGSTNQIELNRERMSAVSMPVPPLEEQRRIADFLDAETARIDKLSSLRSDQVLRLEERLQSIWSIQIDADGTAFGWVPLRRFVIAITDGPFGSSLTSSHYSDSGARVIRLGNIGRAEFRDRDPAYISMDYFAGLKRHEARPGDLVVGGLGDQNHPIGRACVVPDEIGPAMVKADCFRVRLDQRRVSHEYAAWAMSSQRVTDETVFLSRGSTRARINLDGVREIQIPATPTDTQRRTVASLNEVRRSVRAVSERCSRQLGLLAERRQALITAAVTGQFDVSAASGRGIEG